MNYIIVFATHWGYVEGGINSFNFDFIISLGNATRGTGYQIYCVTYFEPFTSLIEFAKENNVVIVSLNKNSHAISLGEDLSGIMDFLNKLDSPNHIFLVGHDVFTGDVVTFLAKQIEKNATSILFHHMDYEAYYGIKGNSTGNEIDNKISEQKNVLSGVNFVIGIGPKLESSAKEKTKAQTSFVIPGLSEGVEKWDEINKLIGITFGRYDSRTDKLKQMGLAAKAFVNFVEAERELAGQDATLKVVGIDNEGDKQNLEQAYFSNSTGYVNVLALPYKKDREDMLNELSQSNVCLMLSVHEGFGLVGLEAIACGVPLILSKNSGLFDFLNAELASEKFESFGLFPVEIAGSMNGEINAQDLSNVVDALRAVRTNHKQYREGVLKLKEKLLEKYKWQNTAAKFLEIIDGIIELDGNSVAPKGRQKRLSVFKTEPSHSPAQHLPQSITISRLIQQFELSKQAWLGKKYIPELHGLGVIQSDISQLLFDQKFGKELITRVDKITHEFIRTHTLIEQLSKSLIETDTLNINLKTLQGDLANNLSQLAIVRQTIKNGDGNIAATNFSTISISRELLETIEAIQPNNVQLGIKERLINALDRISRIDLEDEIQKVKKDANQLGRLFIGNPGTGKTHALSNTVDVQLNQNNSPAIIIRAKGTPNNDWTQILSSALDLTGLNRDQILSALEMLAKNTDQLKNKKHSDSSYSENTKVILCIDGLEEDFHNWSVWYERIRESIELVKQYGRLRFAFTARDYFLNNIEIPNHEGFRVTTIPQEGDVTIDSVIDKYSSPEHFNIQIASKRIIRGIDSLYALRLFCELYTNQVLTDENQVLTAENKLLNRKVEILEDEFRKQKDAGPSRRPIRDAIAMVAEIFYGQVEINHDRLHAILLRKLSSYLTNSDIDNVIVFLVHNGFLIKSELPKGPGILDAIEIQYNLTYQSIMELILADKYADAIITGELKQIPPHLIEAIDDSNETINGDLKNERIVQQIANQLLHKKGMFIGEDGFLSEGLSQSRITRLQTKALILAPKSIGERFKETIDELYFRDYKSRHFIFENLIFPSASSADNFFGAEYLHGLLLNHASAFGREKIWLGVDRYDINQMAEKERDEYFIYSLADVIDPYKEGRLHLSNYAAHNELPLIYGWALATLDQSFRQRLRGALVKWALSQALEFKLLLEKLFFCNDPQIQEDLASVTLGLASRLKDKDQIFVIAQWALENIFSTPETNRNVIVRIGFRAIVEKGFSVGVISSEQIIRARPHHLGELKLIDIDRNILIKNESEIYPILHDLAWYVVKKASDDFLDYGSVSSDDDVKEPTYVFLKAYLDSLGLEYVDSLIWTISAAIAYIKSLGFSRETGNGYTDATHGSKSKKFTLEEKYTWLAVHYLQGYLSDYLPVAKTGDRISDYMSIVAIDNPAESIEYFETNRGEEVERNWIIRELLAPEINDQDNYDERIKDAVESEPVINMKNWLEFSNEDLFGVVGKQNWLALYNYTSVRDSMSYILARLDAHAVIIEKGQARVLLDLVMNYQKSYYFVEGIDRMVGTPDTDTYSNPTDIVWMNWIEEVEFGDRYFLSENGEEKTFGYTVTKVIKNTVDDGEEEVFIPSKTVRTLMGILEMQGANFLDDTGELKAYNHTVSNDNYDAQEMTLVLKSEFLNQLEQNNKEVVWFVDLYKGKNAINEDIKSDEHYMKTRKYFIRYEGENLISEKIWDARFSNRRDEDVDDDEIVISEELKTFGEDYLNNFFQNQQDLDNVKDSE